MKHPLTVYIAALLFMFAFAGCSSNDDGDCQGVDCLPAATQTGENTFGALIDGEPFIPGGGPNPLDCIYQLVNGERYFTLQANKRDEDFNRITLALLTNTKELEAGQSYQLLTNDVGNVYGLYSFATNLSQTNLDYTGSLTISRLDINAQIISGTFDFEILDYQGVLRRVTNGRFDMRFTQ